MKEIIIVGLIFIVIGLIGEYYLKKKFNINRKLNKMSELARRLQRIALSITFIIYMVTAFVLIFKYDDLNTFYIIMPYFIVISLIRFFVQWKYNRHANVWVLELYTFFILLALLVSLNFIKLH